MKRLLLAAAALVLAACSSDNPSTNKCAAVTCPTGQTCNLATGTCAAAATNPDPPALYGLIDRMGRPAVNTALTNPYDIMKTPGTATVETVGDTTKDNYNHDNTPTGWAAKWTPYIRTHLAILDGLDRNCGNQFAADLASPRYSGLAGVLASDWLVVDTSQTTCNQYLAVEAGVANDCGGRKLAYDVIDVTYSALAIGALTGVDDGITNDSTFSSDFPYLAAPNSP